MDLARQPPDHSWRRAALLGTASGIGIALLARHLSPPAETRLHVTGPDGYVEASPAGLARAAGVDLDVYVLASAMQSEERSDRGRLAVGRAAWNAVGGRRDRLASKIIPSGRLGTQLVNPYADTRRPPTARTLGLASAIVEGRVPDFVEGSVQWDAPAAQDRNHALYLRDPARYPKYRWSAADVAARRKRSHAHEVTVPGVPDTRFWSYT
jgi:hypothetical protein